MIARIFRFLAIAIAAHGVTVALFALMVAPRLGDDVPEPFASILFFALYVPASFLALPLRPLLWNLGLIEAPGWFTWPTPLGYTLAYVIWVAGLLVLSFVASRLALGRART